jgi:hypothetical protein
MKFTQLTKTLTAEDLNNRVSKMFGSKINLESFTVEQLSAAKDKLANQLLTIENQANFDAIHSSEAYQKNRLFLKVIEQRIEELSQTDEKAKNPYAIGMAQAMKSTGDQPPLKKSTIKKAHDIAKSVEKNESETTVDENMTRQHFQYVADTLKDIQDPIKRAEYAKHHSAIFQHFNPNFDHDRFMQAAGVYTVTKGKEENTAVEEGKVKSWLMDLESDAVDMTREAFIKKHGQSQAHVWDRVQKKEKENESVQEAKPDFLDMDKDGNKKEPMKKAIKDKEKKMNESVVIATDNPEEAAMMMQLLKLAGVQPVSQDMINQPAEVKADEDYANTPKEKYSDIKAAVPNGTDLNREKGAYVKAAGGDNPMAIKMGESEITEEQLSNSLRAQYESFKQTYQETKAKPDFLDMDKDGNKTEPMKKALKDKESKGK